MENLQRLRVLRAVSHHGSFTAAAAALGMTQPAVSQQVTALEREVGTLLVQRTTTGATLTPEGEVVLRHARRILASCDDARRELDQIRSGELAAIRVAAFPTACSALLPRAAALWRRRYPTRPFEFTECDSSQALELVRHGKADLAIAYDYAAHPIELRPLTVQVLPDDPLLLVVPTAHPVASQPVAELAALAGEPWISGTSFACAESLRAICGVAGFTPRVALDSNHYTTTLALVGAGHGLALVPVSALAGLPRDVVARPLRPGPPPRRLWSATYGTADEALGHLTDCLVATAHRYADAAGGG
ncbi:LysR family transcriptional regulator [Nonomuraea sp. NPDC050663]|uniref:LysR family transcriptional regulator n=1 Tax=Nonomuraea sp. NPDC050663 TaxID=3364370 RepID=UPI0037B4FB01